MINLLTDVTTSYILNKELANLIVIPESFSNYEVWKMIKEYNWAIMTETQENYSIDSGIHLLKSKISTLYWIPNTFTL